MAVDADVAQFTIVEALQVLEGQAPALTDMKKSSIQMKIDAAGVVGTRI